MLFQSYLTRFNEENKPIALDSREYGYLVLQLKYIAEDNSDTDALIVPIKIRFIPDSHLSVNQIMEFKKLHTNMRLILSRQSGTHPEESLKLSFREEKLYITITNKYSQMELQLPEESRSHIQLLLDQLSIVISSNTFFQLDLQEIKQTGKKQYQEWRNYLWSYIG